MNSTVIRLKRDLNGYPPFNFEGRDTIPAGSEIAVEDYDYGIDEVKVLWNGDPFVVNKESLEILGEHD